MMNIWNYENTIVNANYDEHHTSIFFVYPNESTLFKDVAAVMNTSNNWSGVAVEDKNQTYYYTCYQLINL